MTNKKRATTKKAPKQTETREAQFELSLRQYHALARIAWVKIPSSRKTSKADEDDLRVLVSQGHLRQGPKGLVATALGRKYLKDNKIEEPDCFRWAQRNDVGERYESVKDLDIKEIAKLVRADIKKAVKDKLLTNRPYGVRIDRFPGGQSLDVYMQELDNDVYKRGYDLSKKPASKKKPSNGDLSDLSYYELIRRDEYEIKKILDRYNYDHGNIQQDYSRSNFFSQVNLSWKKKKGED